MNIFIVESPLQFLNAVSARYHWKISEDESILIINKNNNENNVKQLNFMIKKNIYKWSRIYVIPPNHPLISFVRLRKLVKKINEKNKINKTFLGDYFSAIYRGISNTKYVNDVILLDDGIGTLKLYDFLTTNKIFGKNKSIIKIVKKIIGLNDSRKKDLIIFTVYKELKSTKEVTVIHNDYSFCKFSQNKIVVNDYVLFLGAPLSEKKFMTEEDYIKIIKKCIFSFDKKLFYIPHRHEDSDKLLKLTKLGVDVQNLPAPIEFALINSMIPIPTSIASFFSSALINLKYILDEENVDIYSVFIKNDLITDEKLELVSQSYEYIKHHIEMIDPSNKFQRFT